MLDAEDPEGLLAGLSGQHVAFAEYLADEVLAQQPPAIQSFLLRTSILETFSVALCEAVFPAQDPDWSARRCIAWIEQHSLFVSSLGSRGDWFQYHEMFRTVLLEQAITELGVDSLADHRRGAAWWFAGQGLVDEAVGYALAAGDRELAAGFVAQGLLNVLNREDRATLDRWLSLFPDEFIQSRPDLLVVRAFSLFFSWQLRPLPAVLAHATELLEKQSGAPSAGLEPGVLRGCLASLCGVTAYFANDQDRTAARCREALELLPQAWSYARGGTMLVQALAMQASGQYAAAARLLDQDYESLHDRTNVYALRLLQGLCMIQYRQGENLEQLALTAQRLATEADVSRLGILESWGHYLAGLAHYQRNELAAAEQSFGWLFELRYGGNLGALRDGALRLGVIHALAGKRVEAGSMAQFLSQLDLEQVGHETDETRALRARLWLIDGNLEAAARWADEFAAPILDEPWPWQDPAHLTKARILLARSMTSEAQARDAQGAAQILARLNEVAERSYNVRLRIEVLALEALALSAAGKAQDAQDALLAALDLARPGGYLRVFLELGQPMRDALSEVAGQDIQISANAHHILAELQRSFGDAVPARHEGNGPSQDTQVSAAPRGNSGRESLVEPLSHRELEILTLLRDPMSLKEVARQLSISYQTAKRHTVNIYGKLGVHRRWDAVTKAQALGLIPPR